jgi:hypothetical protein
MGLGLSFGSCSCRGGGNVIPPWPPPWGDPPPPIITPGGTVYESMEVIWQWKGPGLGLGNHIEVIEYTGAAQPQSGGVNRFQLSPDWNGTITTTTGKTKVVIRMRSDWRGIVLTAQNTQVQPFNVSSQGVGVGNPEDAHWEKVTTIDLGPGQQFRQVNFLVADGFGDNFGFPIEIGNSWGIRVGWE